MPLLHNVIIFLNHLFIKEIIEHSFYSPSIFSKKKKIKYILFVPVFPLLFVHVNVSIIFNNRNRA
jgi:hypothetical protein